MHVGPDSNVCHLPMAIVGGRTTTARCLQGPVEVIITYSWVHVLLTITWIWNITQILVSRQKYLQSNKKISPPGMFFTAEPSIGA